MTVICQANLARTKACLKNLAPRVRLIAADADGVLIPLKGQGGERKLDKTPVFQPFLRVLQAYRFAVLTATPFDIQNKRIFTPMVEGLRKLFCQEEEKVLKVLSRVLMFTSGVADLRHFNNQGTAIVDQPYSDAKKLQAADLETVKNVLTIMAGRGFGLDKGQRQEMLKSVQTWAQEEYAGRVPGFPWMTPGHDFQPEVVNIPEGRGVKYPPLTAPWVEWRYDGVQIVVKALIDGKLDSLVRWALAAELRKALAGESTALPAGSGSVDISKTSKGAALAYAIESGYPQEGRLEGNVLYFGDEVWRDPKTGREGNDASVLDLDSAKVTIIAFNQADFPPPAQTNVLWAGHDLSAVAECFGALVGA